jgi:hypothetical protein
VNVKFIFLENLITTKTPGTSCSLLVHHMQEDLINNNSLRHYVLELGKMPIGKPLVIRITIIIH